MFPIFARQGLVIVSATNFQWANMEHTLITMHLTIADAAQGTVEIPFAADPNDVEDHGRALFDFGTTQNPTAWVPRPISQGELQAELDGLMTDITLNLATEAEINRARDLRTQIKAMIAAAS